ncbi:MAG TPA: MFS transporter [Gemmatimonadaceae bacterium]|nr:MFS transporter [Gemmatimonadaceae bacterium]
MTQRTSNAIPTKLLVLMVTAFVDMVGLLMVLPLLPFYAQGLVGDGFRLQVLGGTLFVGAGQVVAILVSAFAGAQLLSAPVWGRFSDRYGRRPALIVALVASTIAYVLFAFASTLWLLLLSRLLQGAGGGTVGVIQAYVADSTPPEDRAKSLGWLSAVTNAGVALGPVLGSMSATLGPRTPGLAAAALCLINVAIVWFLLHESRVLAKEGAAKPRTSRVAVKRVVTHPSEPSSRLIWIYAIAMGGFQGTTAILALFLAVRFGIDERTIGYFFMYIGVISVVTRAGLLGRMVDRFGEPRLSRAGVVLLAAGLATMPLTHTIPLLALSVALLPLGTAFTFPCVTAMLSRVVSAQERGLYMGVQQTFGGAARFLFPLFAGAAFDHLGIGVPFYIAGGLVLATLLLGTDLERYVAPRAARA